MHVFTNVAAVTGIIGSGKSRVAEWLARHCRLDHLDADRIVRMLLVQGNAGWLALRQELGGTYLTAAGELDKSRLRQAIFTDADLRRRVESLLHPLVLAEIARQLSGIRAKDETRGVLVEVPLLYEAGWQDLFRPVVVVTASEARCLQRVCARDKVAGEQAAAALKAQFPLKEKVADADYVVTNDGAWSETVVQLQRLQKILSGKGA